MPFGRARLNMDSVNTILVIEDDTTIRETLKFSLKAAGFEVLTASDGADGLRAALEGGPDLLLLDLMLPQLSGFEVCKRVRAQGSNVPILMLTALDQEKDKLDGFAAGADDYITKPFSTEELLARINANLRRAGVEAAGEGRGVVSKFGDLVIDRENYRISVAGEQIVLRPKEFLLLTTVCAHPGKVFSRPRLLESVWGYGFVSSSRTIDVHVKRLREKVEGPSAYNFIHTVHSIGYRFEAKKKLDD